MHRLLLAMMPFIEVMVLGGPSCYMSVSPLLLPSLPASLVGLVPITMIPLMFYGFEPLSVVSGNDELWHGLENVLKFIKGNQWK